MGTIFLVIVLVIVGVIARGEAECNFGCYANNCSQIESVCNLPINWRARRYLVMFMETRDIYNYVYIRNMHARVTVLRIKFKS